MANSLVPSDEKARPVGDDSLGSNELAYVVVEPKLSIVPEPLLFVYDMVIMSSG